MIFKNLDLPVSDKKAFLGFSGILLISIVAAIILETPLILGAPVLVLLLLFLLVNYHVFYYLLIIGLPFSIQYDVIAGGLTIDLPSEPLMALLMGCFLASLLIGIKPEPKFYRHPVVILITLMYIWAIASTLFSVDTTKSLKYLAAKAWYIIPFLFITSMLLCYTDGLTEVFDENEDEYGIENTIKFMKNSRYMSLQTLHSKLLEEIKHHNFENDAFSDDITLLSCRFK